MSKCIFRVYIILISCLFVGNCATCSSNCLSCTVSFSCNSCMPGFYGTTFYQCSACSTNCQICSGSSESECSTCFPKFYKSEESSCQACPSQCATCTSNTVCQTCVQPNFIIGTICSVCDTSCKTCLGTSNTCTSCDVGKYLYNQQCLTCTSPCSDCVNDKNNCISCIDIHQTAVNYQCVCNNGYYIDGSNQCQLCIEPCSKCEHNANHCTDCISTFTLDQNKCKCSSNSFQFDSQTCQQCVSPCLTCEQNQNYCLSCVDINQIVNNLHLCVCRTGWILNTDGITCIKCQLQCAECIDTIDKCVICKDRSHQQPNSCICESGWIYDNNYNCIPCIQPCKTCEISTTKCLTCLDPNHVINNLSQCICKSTYYSNSIITCAKCQEPCYECDTYGCINCIDTNRILDSNKQCVCKYGYLQQGIECIQCQNPCSTCINTINECLTCFDINMIVKDYYCICKEGFVQSGDFCCDQNCIDCQGIDNCNNCIKGFYLSKRCLQCTQNCDVCQDQINCGVCKNGYFLNESLQCEICTIFCKICSKSLSCDICLDGYYLINQKCEQCNQNCLTCNQLSYKCLTCKQNYEINTNNQCVCKVGYYEQQNQCFKCEYPCNICLSKTICQECLQLSNLYLDINFNCICNSGYFWNNNRCSQCYQSCLTCIDNQFNCLSCDSQLNRILNNNKCLCIQNYFENENEICISCLDQLGKSQESCKYQDCKDQIWTYGEECDDGNDVNRDGCSNCKIDHNYSCSNEILKLSICYQCSTNCIQCQLNLQTNKSLCIQCQFGYFLDKNDCVQCSNNCLECIDQPYNCKSCKYPQQQNHKCKLCQSGYYADEINGVCLNNCGDYIKVKEEECDDGNIIKGDGCDDQCKLENKYKFINGQSIVPNYPKPFLQSVNTSQIYTAIRIFNLYYTVPIFITNDFQIKDYLTFHIQNKEGIKQMDESFELIQDISQINEFNQSQLTLMINITFSRTSQDELLLIKFINTSLIYSNEGYSQIETEISCLIPKVIYIDDVTINQVQVSTQSNTYMLYSIGTMCIGSIVFGGVGIFFNLLDTLQMLSYLKYINTQFPYNLQTYFQLFGFAQFNFIQKNFDFQGFHDLIVNINHLQKIPIKIAGDNITSLFIINTATITIVWIFLFIIYVIAKVIPKILYSIKFKFYSESETENTWLIKLGVYYLTIKQFINRLCYVIISEFFYSGILRVHMATSNEFIFSIVLQLYTLELNSTKILIRLSSILACIASLLYIFSILFVIQLSQMKKYSFYCKTIKTKYGSVFDGININQFSKYLNAILLIKKLIFMFLLIFAYEFPTFQSISITFLSVLMSLYFILFKPFEDKLEYLKQLVCEVSISVTLLSISILTCDFQFSYFTYEVRQSFGWVCIFFMTSILFIQLVIDSIQQWRFIFKKYKQVRKIAQSILRIFSNNNQVTAPSQVLQ